MFQNLKAFKDARKQIDEIASKHIKGAVREIPWVGKNLGDECRQTGLDGKPTESLDALYEVAKLASVKFKEILTAACPTGVTLLIAPLKGRDRAGSKARDEYADKTPPCFSWLFDITRGAALCQSEGDIVQLYASLVADPRVDIVRTKNRFAPPLFNGYQDILMNVAVMVENASHLCELQIHLMPIKDSEALHKSHTVYECFRSFFLGNSDAVARWLEMLCKLPVDEANDVGELVDHVLRDYQNEAPYRANGRYWGDDDRKLAYSSGTEVLGGLCELLKSISEFAGAVKVQEAILAEKERSFGAESKEVGVALYELVDPVDDLGEDAKARDLLERALPIYEREHGSDGAEVAKVLNMLGSVYGVLGDPAKKRDMLERALAIKERAYGRDHAQVAITLMNLGNAYGDLGDHVKARDMLERALSILERAYGRDHAQVAITLSNLGNAYGDLGDYVKKRDMVERALAIQERAYGRDHVQVAATLTNLGNVYSDLGDPTKMRDMVERALAIYERAYGRDHTEFSTTLTNLGAACLYLGDHLEARDLLERALAIKERAYGRNGAKLAVTLTNLGTTYGVLGDPAKKRDILERALAIKERAYGRDHPELVATLTSLGAAYDELGDCAKERDFLERALAIEERA